MSNRSLQYYYRNERCTAPDSSDPSCTCWHDLDTRPLEVGAFSYVQGWRVKPGHQSELSHDAQFLLAVLENAINDLKHRGASTGSYEAIVEAMK